MGKELFSEELKLAVVQYVLEGHTRKEASEKFCVSCTPIEKWVNLYKLHGTKGLLSRNLVGRQKGFDGEFRLKVLQYKQEHHLSCTQTAMHFFLDVVTVCRWEKKFQKEGAQGLMKKQATKGSEKRQKKQEQSELQQENKRLSEENYRLRMENDYLKKLNALIQKREKPRISDVVAAVTELRRDYPLAALLKLAGIPRSTYYYYSRKANAVDKYAKERAEIIAIYQENQGRYGYRRIGMELRNRGFCLNHKTVQKLMKESGLKYMVRMKKYRSYRGEVGKIAPNLLARDFHAERPNQKWVTDVTEFSLFGSKLYLSPVLDLYNGEIISYAISERANYRQVDEMLDKAFSRLPDSSGLILHSDQGWQYQNVRYQKRLLEKGIRQSMSRKGNCLDNAVMENFFGLLKSELLYLRTFQSLDEFCQELVAYLEYYNYNRIKEKLNGLSPVQYRIQNGFAA
ncbi:IS3 family transposase [Lachnoclostridium edouardi]|uniref:IS3 family transposase n=1 Tax=Lachnoclostridium edouardi TaxID=1926283 RepID=UPI000C7CA78E|nr:IS3 family transposase [Lachnoclostridium edouardi]